VWQQNVGVDPLALGAPAFVQGRGVPEPPSWIVAMIIAFGWNMPHVTSRSAETSGRKSTSRTPRQISG
jgi:hypothetical protein